MPLGLLSGYRGGFIDALISRMTDAMLACPFLILAIALAAFLGPSLGNAMIAIGIIGDADLRAADARPGDERQGRGLCRGRARHGQSALAHRAVSHPAEHHAGAAGAGDAVDRGRDHRRSRAVVPRPRPAAAGAVLGQHAQRRAALPDQRALDGGLAGARDLSRGAVVQPGRRRPARRAGSEGAVGASLTSPRLRGEVGLRSNPGEGVQVHPLTAVLAERAPHPDPLPARAGRGSDFRRDEIS